MKKLLFCMWTLVPVLVFLLQISCTKYGVVKEFTATLEPCPEQDMKTIFSGSNLCWEKGDCIMVFGAGENNIASYTTQTQALTNMATFNPEHRRYFVDDNPPFRAYYPSSLPEWTNTGFGTMITLPSMQKYVEGSIHEFPMYAESSTNNLEFKNLCGVLRLHLTKSNINISNIAVYASSVINGNFHVNNNNGVPELSIVTDSALRPRNGNITILTCATPQSINSGRDFYISIPPGNYSDMQIEINASDGRYCIRSLNIVNIARSRCTTVILGENDLEFADPFQHGELPGLFSIDGTHRVRFSRGNLQYQASTNTWRFAGHQYHYVGGMDIYGNVFENGIKSDNDLVSTTYNGWIDLFGWGTGNNPTLVSHDSNDYLTFVDWGVNSISNGGGQPNKWRTLNSDELLYLVDQRVNKCGVGMVSGVYGFVLLPDNWTLPEGCSFTDSWYNVNNYTPTQWAAMESNGAVFLPSAGYTWNESYPTFGVNGAYWTYSTTVRDGGGYLGFALGIMATPSHWFWTPVYARQSVRLVQDVN